MKLRSLKLKSFMSHNDTCLLFPETGIIIVTGRNGSGKSAISEAVAIAAHGKTLRGCPPWRKGVAGSVELVTDIASIKRSITASGKVSLVWHAADRSTNIDYETTTKAQEALARIVRPFGVWRRASVFSSSDAEHFTLATDGERKRLLEEILGVDRFDEALTACRDDLKFQIGSLQQLERNVSNSRSAVSAAEFRKQEAIESLAQLKPPTELFDGNIAAIDTCYKLGDIEGVAEAISLEPVTKNGKTLLEIVVLREHARFELSKLRSQQAKLSSQGGADEERATQIEKQLKRIQADSCPVCNQAIPDELRAILGAEAEGARGASREARKAGLEAARGLGEAISEAEEEERELSRLMGELKSQTDLAIRAREEARRYITQKIRFENIIDEATTTISVLDVALGEQQVLLEVTQKEVALLSAVETVLGLKGVRAHVLGKALTGIEHVANTWLTRLKCEGLSVKLSPYSEKKSGGVSDSISLTVEGAGEGYGYRAASGGERRRLDVAILLALGEVAEAANGKSGSTLIADELFDALDAPGVEAVSDVLAEISKERLVVVITHNTLLVDALKGAKHYKVDHGVVTEVV